MARISIGRVPRAVLFSLGALVLSDCGATGVMYGFTCDACVLPPDDATTSDAFQFSDVNIPETASDSGSDSASDSGSDSAPASDSGSDSD